MAYIMKYIEKSGEKNVYSRGLPQYFKSDILDDDVVCPIGMEEQKLLLFDNFSCFEDGVYIGEVSPEVIKQMKKCKKTAIKSYHFLPLHQKCWQRLLLTQVYCTWYNNKHKNDVLLFFVL